nr:MULTISPECIES: NINE protein [Mesorhizobium]
MDGTAANKSAGVALILSLLICGLGQFYNGQIGKGILMFVLTIALWFVFLGWIIMIWSAVDAYKTAKAMNLRYHMLLAGASPISTRG